ncbi:hypothetical protein EG834_17735, partial [bacterium]|nr:hypothetical protein [bacterium]
MKMKMRLITTGLVLLLALAACNLQVPGRSVATSIDSVQGTWAGTLTDSAGGGTYTVQLILEQPIGGTTIQGT